MVEDDVTERFVGSIVGRRWRGRQGLAYLGESGLVLRRLFRRPVILPRSAIEQIEVDVITRLPIWWAEDFHFRLVDHTIAPTAFRPVRPIRFRAVLSRLGYPLVEV